MFKLSPASFDRLASLFIVSGVALMLFFLAHLYFEYDVRRNLIKESELGINRFELVTHDVVNTLHRLNASDTLDCDDKLLIEMRREMFMSRYIHDIGFLRGSQLLCTTGLGVLETPFLEEAPDYIGKQGFKVFVNRRLALFDRVIFATIVRLKSYNAVVKLESLAHIVNPEYQWELVYLAADKTHYVSGTNGIYQRSLNYQGSAPQYHTLCSNLSPYCLTLHNGPEMIDKKYQRSYLFALLIVSFLSLVSYVLIRKRIRKYRSLTARIQRGFNRNAFYCLYQPIVELRSGKIIGCEVLARYSDVQGPVFPDQFIPVINQLGLTWDFTEMVLEKTVEDLAAIDGALSDFRFNVNFFAKDISNRKVVSLCNNKLLKSVNIQLIVEITEDEKLTTKSSAEALKCLSDNGFEIAVDDFGTGYSNLKQLREINCDSLKIDRSFISEMEDGSIRSTLIPHIVEIANQLDLKIVAEGVENESQREALISEGVQFAQGWLFGKPMTMMELKKCVEAQTKSV